VGQRDQADTYESGPDKAKKTEYLGAPDGEKRTEGGGGRGEAREPEGEMISNIPIDLGPPNQDKGDDTTLKIKKKV